MNQNSFWIKNSGAIAKSKLNENGKTLSLLIAILSELLSSFSYSYPLSCSVCFMTSVVGGEIETAKSTELLSDNIFMVNTVNTLQW